MTQVLKSSVQLSLQELCTRITSSHIERSPGFIVFFMCSISPSCKIPELLQNKTASRIEIDINAGDIRVWLYDYTPDEPDILINGVLLCEKDMSSF